MVKSDFVTQIIGNRLCRNIVLGNLYIPTWYYSRPQNIIDILPNTDDVYFDRLLLKMSKLLKNKRNRGLQIVK